MQVILACARFLEHLSCQSFRKRSLLEVGATLRVSLMRGDMPMSLVAGPGSGRFPFSLADSRRMTSEQHLRRRLHAGAAHYAQL